MTNNKRYIDRCSPGQLWYGSQEVIPEMIKRNVSIIVVDTYFNGGTGSEVRRTTIKITEDRYLVSEYIKEATEYPSSHRLYVVDARGESTPP